MEKKRSKTIDENREKKTAKRNDEKSTKNGR